jgi:phospholipase D1/2
MVSKQRQMIPQTSQQDSYDSMFLSPPEGFEHLKCNTPDPNRKNLFDMAKTTVDKVKYNVKMKRREWINMVYNPHETSSDDEDIINK